MGQVARFPIDHVMPRKSGGLTELGNLCLACPHCNAIKWAHTEGLDPVTGRYEPLYNPRTQSWAEHFRWSLLHDSPIIEGVTPVGRATINRLHLNHSDMVAIRRLLLQLGLFPEGVP